jgi:hypothetical protein
VHTIARPRITIAEVGAIASATMLGFVLAERNFYALLALAVAVAWQALRSP